MADNQRPIVLQKKASLSESVLFDIHKSFFRREGVGAWKEKVPYYVTSNALFAHQVATLVYSALCEAISAGDIDMDEPVYCLELGAGAGKFMFMFLQVLIPLIDSGPHRGLSFTYVGSDFTEEIVSYWEDHPQFQKYVASGHLDFAVYNAEGTSSITLRQSGGVLQSLKNPLIVIANYLFDSLVHDAFNVSSGKLNEVVVTTSALDPDYESHPEALTLDFDLMPRSLNMYSDDVLNSVLSDYVSLYPDAHFLLPIGGIHCVNYLESLSDKGVFLVSHDKGHVESGSFRGDSLPDIVFHGSISLMVNYDAMSRYFSKKGYGIGLGDPVFGLKSFLVWSGSRDAYPLTIQSLRMLNNTFSSDHFLNLKTVVTSKIAQMTLNELVMYLQLVHWDPDIFIECVDTLLDRMSTVNPAQKALIVKGLRTCEKMIYEFGETPFYFELARVWYDLDYFEHSIVLYERSIELLGNDEFHMYNMALAYYSLSDRDSARKLLEAALVFDPSYEPAEILLGRL